MVHSLILAYGLHKKMKLLRPREATDDELALFHSTYYMDYLKNECCDGEPGGDDESDSGDEVDEEQLNYGLGIS